MSHPSKLGPYRITGTLGRGGMGTVYEAIDETDGTPVAVKLIAQHVADEARFRDRFKTEIKALARLQHPGIVRLLHSHIDEHGRIFYSMELVQGESLHSRLRRDKKVPWREALEIATQVCSALKHAHDAGVTHRDLKPANLMLTPDGSVKLVDFGIAKLFGDQSQTHVGSVLGTADFMAPEQIDSSSATARTDLYALGNVMYAMLCGRPPFSGKRVTEVIHSLKKERPVPLDLIDPYLPDVLVELVQDLLEKNPADRPPTALNVLKRLRSMQAALAKSEQDSEGSTVASDGPATSVTGVTRSGRNADVPTDVTERSMMDDRTLNIAPGTPTPVKVDSNSPTIVSHGRSKTVVGDAEPPPKQNRLEAVTDFHLEDEPTFAGARTDSEARSWGHWLAILLMVTVLAAGAVLLFKAAQPPTADELYAASVEGDDGAMQTFLRRFPEDPRHGEVQQRYMDDQLQAAILRLSTRRKLGVAPLTAYEEGFLSAMADREIDTKLSLQRLQQWLKVYGDRNTEQDSELKSLVRLARFEQQQLQRRSPGAVIDERAQELLGDIEMILREEDPAIIRKRLTGIVETFHDAPWAQPAVERAREELKRRQ